MRLAVALIAAAALLAACGSSSSSSTSSTSSTSSSSSASPSPAGGATKVTIKGLAFSPTSIQAKVGQTITFLNDDTPAHNVEPHGGVSFTGSPTIQPGKSFALHLTKPGTYDYFCSIHPFMTGTIVVK